MSSPASTRAPSPSSTAMGSSGRLCPRLGGHESGLPPPGTARPPPPPTTSFFLSFLRWSRSARRRGPPCVRAWVDVSRSAREGWVRGERHAAGDSFAGDRVHLKEHRLVVGARGGVPRTERIPSVPRGDSRPEGGVDVLAGFARVPVPFFDLDGMQPASSPAPRRARGGLPHPGIVRPPPTTATTSFFLEMVAVRPAQGIPRGRVWVDVSRRRPRWGVCGERHAAGDSFAGSRVHLKEHRLVVVRA